MTFPVIPPAHRHCSRSIPSRSGRARTDGPVVRSTCPYRTAPRIVVPFGRDGHGRAVTGSVAPAQNLLVYQPGGEDAPLLPLTLVVATLLSATTDRVFVADPYLRHRWVDRVDSAGRARWASHPDAVSAMMADLVSTEPDRRHTLVLAGLATMFRTLDTDGRHLLAEVIGSARAHGRAVVAVSSERQSRWFPRGVIDAFDDVVVRAPDPGRRRTAG